MKKVICGIQQMGIGIPNVQEAFDWYRKSFGVDIKIFEEAAEAKLMLPYTGGKPRSRHAILALSLLGGGGFEIWQYLDRDPKPAEFVPNLGDLGIYVCKLKSPNVRKAYKAFKEQGMEVVGELNKGPKGRLHFFVKDPYGNLFQVVEGYGWFKKEKKNTGAVFGAIIGVSDMEESIRFYEQLLGYDVKIYKSNGIQSDLKCLPGGGRPMKRVLLKHKMDRSGAFSRLLGPSELELVQLKEEKGKKIFRNRFWGDLGFIHLCYDIAGMDALRKECREMGYPFTIDSTDSFDMGEAAGHFAYIEDPDGTLIEFVETHKVPVMKKLGLYLNLKKRNPEKPLPNWMVRALGLNRVKDKKQSTRRNGSER